MRLVQHCRGCPNAYNFHFDAGHGHDHNFCRLNSHLLDTDGKYDRFKPGTCTPKDSLTYNKEIDVKELMSRSGAM